MTLIKQPPETNKWTVMDINDLDTIMFFASNKWFEHFDEIDEDEELEVQLTHVLEKMPGLYSIEEDGEAFIVRKHEETDSPAELGLSKEKRDKLLNSLDEAMDDRVYGSRYSLRRFQWVRRQLAEIEVEEVPKVAMVILETVVDEKGHYIPCFVKEGESGYYKSNYDYGANLEDAKKAAEQFNENLGITKEGAFFMVLESMRVGE